MEKNRLLQANEASQILRWGTPGWVFILGVLLFAFTDGLANSLLGGDATFLRKLFESGKDSLVVAILIAAAGIPIGYLLYQIYFAGRWNARWAPNKVLFLHGRIRDMEETINGSNIERIIKRKKWREEFLLDAGGISEGHVTDHRKTWYLLENLFLDFAAVDDSAKLLYERSRYLLDIYHALGTGMVAIVCSWLSYLLVTFAVLRLYQSGWSQLAGIVGQILVLVILWRIFQSNRDNTRSQIISMHNYLLRKMANSES